MTEPLNTSHEKTAARSRALRILAVAVLLLLPSGFRAQRLSEQQVQAAYLFNFGRFVMWPGDAPGTSESFNICVFGQDPFGPALDNTLQGEVIQGKAAAARRIQQVAEIRNCRIVFISNSEERRLPQILNAAENASALTVSEIADFTRRGGMIQFIRDGGRVRFEVNLSPASDAGLTLSSELLKVAVAVRR